MPLFAQSDASVWAAWVASVVAAAAIAVQVFLALRKEKVTKEEFLQLHDKVHDLDERLTRVDEQGRQSVTELTKLVQAVVIKVEVLVTRLDGLIIRVSDLTRTMDGWLQKQRKD